MKPKIKIVAFFTLPVFFAAMLVSAHFFSPKKSVAATTTSVREIVVKDSDGDGISDDADPHPNIAEIYVVKDRDSNGVVDAFSQNYSPTEGAKLNYGAGVVIDSDLDGLTDLGEKEIFKTDFNDPDTDGDGVFDGAEIINGVNPLDSLSPSATKVVVNYAYPVEKETPWAWYFARAAGLVSFFLLYLSILFGLSIRTPILNRIFKPIFSLELHRAIAVQALIFSMLHGTAFLFDKYLNFSLKDILIPFHLESILIDTKMVAAGILAFYLMLALIATSYLKKYIGQRIWRFVHSFNILLYGGGIYHALYLGTDLKNAVVRDIFIALNEMLAVVFIINILIRIKMTVMKKAEEHIREEYAHIHQGDSEGVTK